MSDTKKNVVLVGGGGAGAFVARFLAQRLDPAKHTLTLINARPFIVFLPAAVRMAVSDEGRLEDQILIPYDKLMSHGIGEVRIGRVVAIEEERPGAGGHVVMESGDKLHYDALVLMPGTSLEGPLKYPDTREATVAYIEDWRKKFRNSSDIVMAGGGPVNIEFAGEIKEHYPYKRITIIQSRSLPLHPSYPDKFRRRVEQECRARGIEFVFEDYLDQEVPEDGAVTTRKGKRIPADLVIVAKGGTPNTQFIKDFDADVVTEYGKVRVNPSMEIVKHPGVFCAGDVIDNKERNGLRKYEQHADVVATNVVDYLNGRPLSATYAGSPDIISISLGKSGGVAYKTQFGGLIFGNWYMSMFVAGSLSVPKARKFMGY
ncbi:FAD/NAD-P-binding domain-containing protein [Artomyces pyxidatus]|uniref:FAD/NAD-P-binding domain-containing protein n=1 Tax=Artomyces pyxidatus TaxID=48021 RepID=A0ACB8SIF0_9AGAM|nr:FAD/NAD-P-binding domain-containing protein [Artomyces pyxidatus]